MHVLWTITGGQFDVRHPDKLKTIGDSHALKGVTSANNKRPASCSTLARPCFADPEPNTLTRWVNLEAGSLLDSKDLTAFSRSCRSHTIEPPLAPQLHQ
jgi:hypothetical protein